MVGPGRSKRAPAQLPIRVAVVTEAADLGGAALSLPVAAALAQAAKALADAGYEMVDEKTPGFAQAFELWFEMFIPEFDASCWPTSSADGDDGVRTAMRLMAENVPDRGVDAHLKALADRTRLIRDWYASSHTHR